MPTGVDRVEHAYLTQFLADDVACFGLVRTTFGYLLLDRQGLQGVLDRVEGRTDWGDCDHLTRLSRNGNTIVKRAEADFRRLAVGRSTPWFLRHLCKKLPYKCTYYNVGHSNLTDRVLSALKRAGVHLTVLVHDVIPLEYPQFQRRGTVEPFRAKIKRVRQCADLVIYNSEDTRDRTEAQMKQWGALPQGLVAHLGTITPVPDSAALPPSLPPEQPYFVTVGTIEPRKNHIFLLDIWQQLGPDAPVLLICGARGWNNDVVFDRLDALDPNGPVREIANLSDAALAALVQGAAGALFPSLAEGFGLPPCEALALRTRVLCNDLPVLHEFLGYMPVYASVSDRYQWQKIITSWANDAKQDEISQTFVGPTWTEHFSTVLSARN